MEECQVGDAKVTGFLLPSPSITTSASAMRRSSIRRIIGDQARYVSWILWTSCTYKYFHTHA